MPGAADPGRPREASAEAGPFTLPNLITLARLCAVPATIWLVLNGSGGAAFLLFVAAGISDGIDGWLARRHNSRSALGAIMDPLADKALLVSIYVTLAITNALPDWIAILVVFRDILIVGGVLALTWAGSRPPIEPILLSKANTVAQIALAAMALLAMWKGWPGPQVIMAMVWLVAATTAASGVAYVAGQLRR
ncbi:cardiolipin synthase [Humitalea rosea]|uniref:CDP-diacylglycerol--glycerol-3-phosphate 3-phosphatidyltransferase n=1 Tax=Humitalea rosea TaxID=990373 RepID=A0A2W7I5P1_9PROT|nr:CDP-alcohol phosphatidyltransferase family protein [Humitalea rosea]PZW42196.1 cardiolipin synthase [Humitalea rosea]